MVGRIYKEDYYTLLYTQNIKALGLVVSEKIFNCFPIVSLWELSVAMEPEIRFDPNTFSPTQ